MLLYLFAVVAADNDCSEQYKPLGCFSNDYPLPGKLPSPLANVNPTFTLTNVLYEDAPFEWVNPPSQRFIEREVIAVVHGWITDSEADWMQEARRVYKTRNVNYVMVDWRQGAWAAYDQAVADTQITGRAIAYAFNELAQQGHRGPFKCVGHSLGGHICSWAAKYANEMTRSGQWQFTFEHITGLDPAGPGFMRPKEGRIDYTDAPFVDTIITSLTGLQVPVGHANFFVNGGRHQPQCVNGADDCEHMEAAWVWIDSIKNDAKCVFHRCTDYQAHLNGHCDSCDDHTDSCNVLGIDAAPSPPETSYFATTIAETPQASVPYC